MKKRSRRGSAYHRREKKTGKKRARIRQTLHAGHEVENARDGRFKRLWEDQDNLVGKKMKEGKVDFQKKGQESYRSGASRENIKQYSRGRRRCRK